MDYSTFQTLEEYLEKHSGSALMVSIVNQQDPADLLVGMTSGLNPNENFETLPVEEAGNEGVDEIAQGRHDGSMSVPAFWTPQWNDRVPTRENFIGKTYMVIVSIGAKRPGEGTVVDVFLGCKLNNVSSPFSARGLRSFNLSFVFEDHKNGAQWAAGSGGVP